MINELIFCGSVFLVSSTVLGALKLGKEALIALISLLVVLANLFVIKEITLMGLSATASDALAVGAALALNIVQEYYGRQIAQRAIGISFSALFLYTVLSLLHIAYRPGYGDTTQVHFYALLAVMPHIALASLTTYLIVQSIDCQLYSILQKKTVWYAQGMLKNYLCVGITQLLDTVLFSFLALYGIVDNIGQIIITSYTIKIAVIFLAAPFLHFSHAIIKQ